MKDKICLFVCLIFVTLLLPLSVRATSYTEWGNQGGGTTGGNSCKGEDSCWPSASNNTSYALRGVRVKKLL